MGRIARLLFVAACLTVMGCGASIEELCAKCEECLREDRYFDEGFCEQYWDGSQFDYRGCVDDDDTSEVDGPRPMSVDDLSCDEFDGDI